LDQIKIYLFALIGWNRKKFSHATVLLKLESLRANEEETCSNSFVRIATRTHRLFKISAPSLPAAKI
jgi:hypothetical protein